MSIYVSDTLTMSFCTVTLRIRMIKSKKQIHSMYESHCLLFYVSHFSLWNVLYTGTYLSWTTHTHTHIINYIKLHVPYCKYIQLIIMLGILFSFCVLCNVTVWTINKLSVNSDGMVCLLLTVITYVYNGIWRRYRLPIKQMGCYPEFIKNVALL